MNTIEEHRRYWAKIAKQNGWYQEPFHVIVWYGEDGKVVDSVSHKDLDRDYEAFN